jgi:hypothetical protein
MLTLSRYFEHGRAAAEPSDHSTGEPCTEPQCLCLQAQCAQGQRTASETDHVPDESNPRKNDHVPDGWPSLRLHDHRQAVTHNGVGNICYFLLRIIRKTNSVALSPQANYSD